MNLNYFLLSALIAVTFLSGCKKKEDPAPAAVVQTSLSVNTGSISSISETIAIGGGTITSGGTSAVTAAGVCWDTISGPTILGLHTNNSISAGTFTSSMSGLTPNRTYYVKAYVSNASGTAYGNEISFKTSSAWIPATGVGNNLQCINLCISGNAVFVASHGGVFKSIDEGASWTSANNGFPDLSISDIQASGTNLFASSYNSGVFISTDGGNNWQASNSGLSTMTVQCLAAKGSTVIAGTANGIFISIDNGSNWTSINNGLPNNPQISSLAYDGNVLLVNVGNNQLISLFKSTNNGVTWNQTANGLSGSLHISTIAIISNHYFIGCPFNMGAYVSVDSGTSWSAVNSLLQYPLLNRFAAKGNNIYASGYQAVYTSIDNGSTFTGVSKMGLPQDNIFGIVTTPNYIIAASLNSGIYRRAL